VNQDILGAYVGDGTATSNTVTITAGRVAYVAGGGAYFGDATGNTVLFSGTATGSVQGGSVGNIGNARNNTATISGGSVLEGLYGGKTYKGDATGNTATLTGGSLSGGEGSADVYGGYTSTGNATDNTASISGGDVSGKVYGGYTYSGNATANRASITGGAVGDVYGGYAGGSSGNTAAVSNTVTISNGAVNGHVHGGYARNGVASGNSVTLSGGTVGGNVYGALLSSGDAKGNTVTISGGKVSGNVYGGSTAEGDATGNTVNISGAPNLAASAIAGGERGFDARTGNTLNLYSSALAVRSLQNFEFLNFYLPTTLAAGAAMLNVAEAADITGAKVNVGINGAATPLKAGDTITLINVATAGGLTGAPANTVATGTGMQGVTLAYEFAITKAGDRLLATVGGKGPVVVPASGVFPEARAASAHLLGETGDLWTEVLVPKTRAGAWLPVLKMKAGRQRIEPESRMDITSFTLAAGAATALALTPGNLTLGALAEFGNSNYDTRDAIAGALRNGDGGVRHYGGGLFARMDFNAAAKIPGAYAEASVRAGKVRNAYYNTELASGFTLNAPYVGAHLAAGYTLQVRKATLDLSAKYLLTRLAATDTRLTTGDPMSFDVITSHRLRALARVDYPVMDGLTPYAGLGCEYEFDGEVRARTNGHAMRPGEMKGATGIGELGLKIVPAFPAFPSLSGRPVTAYLSVQGNLGQREGVLGMLRVSYEF